MLLVDLEVPSSSLHSLSRRLWRLQIASWLFFLIRCCWAGDSRLFTEIGVLGSQKSKHLLRIYYYVLDGINLNWWWQIWSSCWVWRRGRSMKLAGYWLAALGWEGDDAILPVTLAVVIVRVGVSDNMKCWKWERCGWRWEENNIGGKIE